MGKRWIRHLGPPLVAVTAIGFVAAGPGGRVAGAAPLPGCDVDGPALEAAIAARPVVAADAVGAAWYRLAPVLGDDGALAGQGLELGIVGGPAWQTTLPPESFASGPVGRLVLVGADDGRASVLRLVDAMTGCAVEVGRAADVVRSAVLEPDGRRLHEHRVARDDRRDLGVWQRAVGSTQTVRELAPASPEAGVGLVFGTPLVWSVAGNRLVVASCGLDACRLRWWDPEAGTAGTVDGLVGAPIGASATGLIAYEPCPALPCPIVEIDLGDGRRTTLADAAGAAVVTGEPGDADLVFELGDGRHLGIVDLATHASSTVDVGDGDSLFAASSWASGVGLAAPDGTVVVGDAATPAASSIRLLSIAELVEGSR